MKAADALDFEDLLLRAAELFKKEPWVLGSIKHIFVDEFQVSLSVGFPLLFLRFIISSSTFHQDTNVTQYGLLKFVLRSFPVASLASTPFVDLSIFAYYPDSSRRLPDASR
jgi:hypothetical protein